MIGRLLKKNSSVLLCKGRRETTRGIEGTTTTTTYLVKPAFAASGETNHHL